MIENAFVKKLVKGVLRNRKQSLLDRSIMHPGREWFSGLAAGLCVLSLGVAWGVSTYTQFSNISVGSGSGEDENVVYRESLVETALVDIEARKEEYEALKRVLLSRQEQFEVVTVPEVDVTEVATTTTEAETSSETQTVPEDLVEGEVFIFQ